MTVCYLQHVTETNYTVKLVLRGYGLTRTRHQPQTKSYVQTDFCPFTPSYVDKLVMCGWWTQKCTMEQNDLFLYGHLAGDAMLVLKN